MWTGVNTSEPLFLLDRRRRLYPCWHDFVACTVARYASSTLNVSGAVVGWAINNREPVFQLLEAVVLFPFEMCGLIIGDEWLSFYYQAR
jgi:hypothetical protein